MTNENLEQIGEFYEKNTSGTPDESRVDPPDRNQDNGVRKQLGDRPVVSIPGPASDIAPTLGPSKRPDVTLTPEQELALAKVLEWMEKPSSVSQEFKLGGFAGTGKTTLIKSLIARTKKDRHSTVSAFTGKACSVLGRKGVRAQTLHSLIYELQGEDSGHLEFVKRSFLEDYPDLLIIDEASMVSTEIYRDLLSFSVKCLFVGDPGQLEPVGDNPDLMRSPDFILSTIHRQAAESPIIQFATDIRTGLPPSRRISPDGNLIIKGKDMQPGELAGVDQVICATNKVRKNLNNRFRVSKGLKAGIDVGEKLICLRNNISLGVFNGLIFFVDEIKKEETIFFRGTAVDVWWVKCHDEIGKTMVLPVWKQPFLTDLTEHDTVPKCAVKADYAYAITCHKSQGSEWDSVLVIDELMPARIWDMKRWRYTAITRAAKQLKFCM